MKGLILAIAVSAALIGCSGAHPPAPIASRPTIDPATLNGANDTPAPSDAPSDAPAGGPTTQKVGDKIDITCDGTDCMTVSVDKIETAKIYKDPQHYLDDTVSKKGDLFLAFHVTYKAIGPNADYNPLDWGVYVNDEIDQVETFVSNGPKPELSEGDLPQGKTASGWIVQEVPPTGRVVIAYQPTQTDIFEVVARSK
jgi:hypothetical protein